MKSVKNKVGNAKQGKKGALDFDSDKYLVDWLKGRKTVTMVYKPAMRKYIEFTGKSPKELLEEKQDELSLPRMQQGKVDRGLIAFFQWLKEESSNEKTEQKGLSAKTAKSYVGAIASFYHRFNLKLDLNWSEDFKAAPLPENRTEKMTASQIEKIASFAPTLRDKAIIWCMFQSGSDISTVLSWNWGHIENEFLNPPLGAVRISCIRKKEEVPYQTFIYKTAIKHLRLYLEAQYGKDFATKMRYDVPLFLGRSGERHSDKYFRDMLRHIAPRTEIANGSVVHAIDNSTLNPLRPHSLRASFNDQMASDGASKEMRDEMLGHKVAYDSAYFGGEETMRKTYVAHAEKVLEPKGASPQVENLLKDQEAKLKEQEKKLGEYGLAVLELQKKQKQMEEDLRWCLNEINAMEREATSEEATSEG